LVFDEVSSMPPSIEVEVELLLPKEWCL
jgi:hypothetical protein